MLILLVLPSLHHCCDRLLRSIAAEKRSVHVTEKEKQSLVKAANLRSVQVTKKERRRFGRRFKYIFQKASPRWVDAAHGLHGMVW